MFNGVISTYTGQAAGILGSICLDQFNGDAGRAAVTPRGHVTAGGAVEVAIVVRPFPEWQHGVVDEQEELAASRHLEVGAKPVARVADLPHHERVDTDISARHSAATIGRPDF